MTRTASKHLKQLIPDNSCPLPFSYMKNAALEFYAQAELPSSHLGEAGGRELCDLAGGLGIDVSIGLSLIHIIKGIKQLGAELSIHAFGDPQPLAE